MPAHAGDTVVVGYTIKKTDGTIYASSPDETPLRFTLGNGEVVPGFEEVVLGMEPGEERSAEVEAERAFGPRSDSLVWEVPREELAVDPKEGQQIALRHSSDRLVSARVIKVTPGTVVLDANHPLAGLSVIFDVHLQEVG